MLMLYKVVGGWKPDHGAPKNNNSCRIAQIYTAIVVDAYVVLRSRYTCRPESRAQWRRAWFVFA